MLNYTIYEKLSLILYEKLNFPVSIKVTLDVTPTYILWLQYLLYLSEIVPFCSFQFGPCVISKRVFFFPFLIGPYVTNSLTKENIDISLIIGNMVIVKAEKEFPIYVIFNKLLECIKCIN
jgi:hypothetical protein